MNIRPKHLRSRVMQSTNAPTLFLLLIISFDSKRISAENSSEIVRDGDLFVRRQ